MYVAKVARKCVVNICIAFTFGAIHVIYLLLNDFNLMGQTRPIYQYVLATSRHFDIGI